MKPFYDWIGGRSLTFAWFCMLSATALAAFNRLPPAYAAAISACVGFVCYRATKDGEMVSIEAGGSSQNVSAVGFHTVTPDEG